MKFIQGKGKNCVLGFDTAKKQFFLVKRAKYIFNLSVSRENNIEITNGMLKKTKRKINNSKI